ncbi:MAG: hypothetical protein Q4F69_11880 [Bacteroidia bacterium]|nr:hypothetical protein [Bacteroidia bacterium]
MMKRLLLVTFVSGLLLCFSQCRKPVLPHTDSGGGLTQIIRFTTTDGGNKGDLSQIGSVLNYKWEWDDEEENRDRIYVYASADGTFDDGQFCGVLVLESVSNEGKTGVFKGTVKMPYNMGKVRFFHFGDNVNVISSVSDAGAASVSFDQQYGKLADKDCSEGEESISSKIVAMCEMNYSDKGVYDNGVLKIQFAVAKFSFVGFDKTDITLGEIVKNKINVTKNGVLEFLSVGGTVALKNANASTEYYCALVPEKEYGTGEEPIKTKCDFIGEHRMLSGTIAIKPNVFFSNNGDAVVAEATMLAGKFSVSENKQVQFSKGNLFYDGTSWCFESSQADYPKTYNASRVGHFYFSKNEIVAYNGGTYSDVDKDVKDVLFTNKTNEEPNENFEVNGQKGVWRTLSIDEWNYLLYERTDCDKLKKNSTTSSLNGLIILPDSGSIEDFDKISSVEDLDNYNAVFLPLTNHRLDNVIYITLGWRYWSSTAHETNNLQSYYVHPTLNVKNSASRGNGFAIRLVTDVKSSGTGSASPFGSGNW